MSLIKRPMLASPINIEDVKFPVMVSAKIDGIRALKIDGKLVSRKLKPIPNQWIASILEKLLPEGADGELVTGDTFQDTSSDVMTVDKPCIAFTYYWFDWVRDSLDEPFEDRYEALVEYWHEHLENFDSNEYAEVLPVSNVIVKSQEQLSNIEKIIIDNNDYEGLIFRDPNGRYKCGRSTKKEGLLLKYKRFKDAEAEIIGFVELMHNNNPVEVDELGYTKRSTAKAGKVPAGTLGKFLVRDIKTGIEFEIGTGEGLTQKLRQEIWNNKEDYLGKIVKYKYQSKGMKDRPRFPIMIGFRHEDDM